MASYTTDPKEPHKLQELADISKAIDLLCLLNINDLRSALRNLEGSFFTSPHLGKIIFSINSQKVYFGCIITNSVVILYINAQ